MRSFFARCTPMLLATNGHWISPVFTESAPIVHGGLRSTIRNASTSGELRAARGKTSPHAHLHDRFLEYHSNQLRRSGRRLSLNHLSTKAKKNTAHRTRQASKAATQSTPSQGKKPQKRKKRTDSTVTPAIAAENIVQSGGANHSNKLAASSGAGRSTKGGNPSSSSGGPASAGGGGSGDKHNGSSSTPPHTASPDAQPVSDDLYATSAVDGTPFLDRVAREQEEFERQQNKVPDDIIDALVNSINGATTTEMTAIMEQLDASPRRLFLVHASATEWFGTQSLVQEKLRADSRTKDDEICSRDLQYYLSDATVRAAKQMAEHIPPKSLLQLAVLTGIPFAGFGFLDNTVMILSGDLIGHTIGATFGLSVMAAAGLGGIVSGTFGMQFHGIVEIVARKFGFSPPVMTRAQRNNPLHFRAQHVGGTIGIAIGLVCGMTPLLFLSSSS